MSKANKGSKKIFVKVIASILALLMVSSMCFTVVAYLVMG